MARSRRAGATGVGAADRPQRMKVVFDLGGVLLRWQPHEFMPRLLPALASTPEAAHTLVLQFFQLFGGDWGEFDRGSLDVAPLAERIARRVGLTPAEARIVIDAVPDELVPIAGTVELLHALQARGHELFFLSNMPAPYAELLEARNDFFGMFRDGLFSSRVGCIKPEPAIFDRAVRTFGSGVDDTVFIDDVAKNLVPAAAVGWQGILFRDPPQCAAELRALGLL